MEMDTPEFGDASGSCEISQGASLISQISVDKQSDQSSNNVIIEYLKKLDSKMDYMGKKLNTLDSLEKKVGSFENELKSLKLSVFDHLKKIDEKVLKADERVDTLDLEWSMMSYHS